MYNVNNLLHIRAKTLQNFIINDDIFNVSYSIIFFKHSPFFLFFLFSTIGTKKIMKKILKMKIKKKYEKNIENEN